MLIGSIFVRLNLFNHVLALFRAKFVCNLAIRYHVFRWDLCKGCKENSRYVHLKESHNWLETGKSPK